MKSIPTFREACNITGFIPDGSELAYAEMFILSPMNIKDYREFRRKRNRRLIDFNEQHRGSTQPPEDFIDAWEDNDETDRFMARKLKGIYED